MSRFKHVLTRFAFAAALIAVPVVPLAATLPAHAPAAVAQAGVRPDCFGCW